MEAIILLLVLGIIFGLLLGLADRFLSVQVDERIMRINELLPQFNCGACGCPGCMGLAEAVIAKEARVSQCKPIKPDKLQEIYDYLEEAVGPNGEKIDLKDVK